MAGPWQAWWKTKKTWWASVTLVSTPEELVGYGRQRDKIFGMDRHWHRQLRYQLETMYMCYILNCVKKEAPDIMEQAFVSCSIFLGKLPFRVLRSRQAMMRWTSFNWPCISACPTSSNTFKYRLGRCGGPKRIPTEICIQGAKWQAWLQG
jgi:hypothetical protein